MDLDDVRRLARALPEVEERTSWDRPAWFVGRLLARSWDDERLTVRLQDDEARLAAVAEDPELCSTTDHHAGSPYVLVALAVADEAVLDRMLREAWWWAARPTTRRRHPDLDPRRVRQ